MPSQASNRVIRQLDFIERGSQVLFGLINAPTFSGSFRITGGDHDSVDGMLLAALGRNLAWGIVDAVMYLMATFSQRSRRIASAVTECCYCARCVRLTGEKDCGSSEMPCYRIWPV